MNQQISDDFSNYENDQDDTLFKNFNISEKQEDEKEPRKTLSSVIDRIFNRVERILVILQHDYLSEVEAASYLRLSDPEGEGRDTIRNYALRTKTLTFAKIGRNGLIFTKTDLDNFLRSKKVISHRDV